MRFWVFASLNDDLWSPTKLCMGHEIARAKAVGSYDFLDLDFGFDCFVQIDISPRSVPADLHCQMSAEGPHHD